MNVTKSRGEVESQLRMLTKRRLVETGLTQRQLAERAHISPGTLSMWLRNACALGRDKQDRDNLTKLCGALRDLRKDAVNASILAEAEALALAG